VADQLRQKWPKLAAFIDDSETDVLSHLDFPEQHRAKVHSTDEIDKLPVARIGCFSVRSRRAVFPSRPGSRRRRAQRRSRVAAGHRVAALSALERGEHGVTLAQAGRDFCRAVRSGQ
jgi:transposase-like protein